MFRPVSRCVCMASLLWWPCALAAEAHEGWKCDIPSPAGETALGLSCHYAQTSWPGLHRDARNSDFVPFAVSRFSQVKWTALDGASLLAAPTIGPEGQLYVTTGRGPGTSHLHAYDAAGHLLWESAPQEGPDDLDAVAVAGVPVIDAFGDLYLSDADQMWAFHPDGTLKWVSPLPEGSGPLFSPIINGRGHVGGAGANGMVVFYHRDSGQLALPVLDLPGGGGAIPDQPPPEGLSSSGLVDPSIVEMLVNVFFGNVYEVTSTPAVHPWSGRLYIAAGGAAPDMGTLYGIDVADEALEIVFETPLPGGGGGASPVISPDGAQVYAVGGDTRLLAVDAETGAVNWMVEGAGVAASPSAGRDGTVYVARGAVINARHPQEGTLKWSIDLSERALEALPPLPALLPIFPNGRPLVLVNSVITITPRFLWVVAVLSYEYAEPQEPKALGIPRATLLLAMRPEDGSIAAGTILRDTCGGTISVGRRGDLYVSHGAIISAYYYYEVNPSLPDVLKVPAPIGGLTALRPTRWRDLFETSVGWMRQLGQEVLDDLLAGEPEDWLGRLDLAVHQLDAAGETLEDAVAEEQLAPISAMGIRLRLDEARRFYLASREALAAEWPGAVPDTRRAERNILAAHERLGYALAIWTVIPAGAPDYDGDGDVDGDDLIRFAACVTGPALGPVRTVCADRDLDGDGDVDQADFALFQRCLGDGVGDNASRCLR